MRENPDPEKIEESESASLEPEEIERKPACPKVYIGVPGSVQSKWTVEFSRRFGPG
ncbi:MAG: hypothetical protein ACP5VS_14345 [Desulfomonilaceae bacterium]